jgi:hypothetical protein
MNSQQEKELFWCNEGKTKLTWFSHSTRGRKKRNGETYATESK